MSNISGKSNYRKFIDAITPTDVESDIVNNAIQYLRGTGSRIVLVGLFPRVLNTKAEETAGIQVGTIKLSGSIETHTALLYSAEENILVIGPNNPQFSAFLKSIDPNIIQFYYRANDKIYTRAGENGPERWTQQKIFSIYRNEELHFAKHAEKNRKCWKCAMSMH